MGLLGDVTDGNAWLDENKVAFTDNNDALPEALTATSIVRGRLITKFSEATIDAWDAATSTAVPPQIIRTVTGMLMASFRYAKKYSEESANRNNYAQSLYNQAIALLDQLLSGAVLLGDGLDDSSVSLEQADFYPNELAGMEFPATPYGDGLARKFTMDGLVESYHQGNVPDAEVE